MAPHSYTERDPLISRSNRNEQDVEETKIQPLSPLDMPADARRLVLAGIWLAQFLSSLNLTLVPTMLPFISSDFQKAHQASWVGTSYLLATTAFTPLYGRLANAMGRRGATQSALAFAGTGILLCGLSLNMEQLIAARFISGLGGGGIFTMAAIITSDMYSLRARGFVQSIGGIFYGLGMGLGGPIGGAITDWLGWRMAFLVQVPFFVVSVVLITFNLRYTTNGSGKTPKEILKRIDYGGILTLMGSVTFLLLFLTARFSQDFAWSDYRVWGALSLSVSFLALFLIVEAFVAIEPVLPMELLSNRVPVLVGCSNALVAVCNLSISYHFPMFFQTVMMTSASVAGLHLLPNSVCISTGSIFAGWMMRKYGAYKLLNMIFGFLPFLAATSLATMNQYSGVFQQWFTIMPLGLGNAVVIQTMYIALVANLPEDQMAIGTGFSQLLRGLGQVGGLAISSAVFQSVLSRELSERIRGDNALEMITKIRHSPLVIKHLPAELQQSARDAFAVSLRSVFILAATASLLAYIARIPIPDKNLEDSPASPSTTSESDPPSTGGSTLVSDDEGSDGEFDGPSKGSRV